MSTTSSAAVVVIFGFLLTRIFSVSPIILLMLGLLLLFVVASSQSPSRAEQFSPVYTSGVASGLKYGVAAIQGRRPYMEDMHQIVDFPDDATAASVRMTHFFAVFDGHGGKRAAAWAHANLVANLLRELETAQPADSPGADHGQLDAGTASSILDGAAVDAFHRTDAAFLRQAAARGIPDGSTAVTCMIQQATGSGGGSSGGPEGRRLLVANLGDSRCVMVRNDGSAIALSSDHKPNRPDERLRVQEAGGQVVYAGCWRVQGDLAVSRAFGDAHLKPYGVSSTPELSAITLTDRDAFLVSTRARAHAPDRAVLAARMRTSGRACPPAGKLWGQCAATATRRSISIVARGRVARPCRVAVSRGRVRVRVARTRFVAAWGTWRALPAGSAEKFCPPFLRRGAPGARMPPSAVAPSPLPPPFLPSPHPTPSPLRPPPMRSSRSHYHVPPPTPSLPCPRQVLASDGLWDVVDEPQCASSLLRASDPLSAARSLCDLASTRGSMDNITVLVVAL